MEKLLEAGGIGSVNTAAAATAAADATIAAELVVLAALLGGSTSLDLAVGSELAAVAAIVWPDGLANAGRGFMMAVGVANMTLPVVAVVGGVGADLKVDCAA